MKRFIGVMSFCFLSLFSAFSFANGYFIIQNNTAENMHVYGSGHVGNFYADGIKNPSGNQAVIIPPGGQLTAKSTTQSTNWGGGFGIFSSDSFCSFTYHDSLRKFGEKSGSFGYQCIVSSVNNNTFNIVIQPG